MSPTACDTPSAVPERVIWWSNRSQQSRQPQHQTSACTEPRRHHLLPDVKSRILNISWLHVLLAHLGSSSASIQAEEFFRLLCLHYVPYFCRFPADLEPYLTVTELNSSLCVCVTNTGPLAAFKVPVLCYSCIVYIKRFTAAIASQNNCGKWPSLPFHQSKLQEDEVFPSKKTSWKSKAEGENMMSAAM